VVEKSNLFKLRKIPPLRNVYNIIQLNNINCSKECQKISWNYGSVDGIRDLLNLYRLKIIIIIKSIRFYSASNHRGLYIQEFRKDIHE